MGTRPTGGPAFPCVDVAVTGISSDGEERFETQAHDGMTLRDYFAAKAPEVPIWFDEGGDYQAPVKYKISRRVQWAFAWADAMITERDK